jgi:protein phosphatase
MGSPIYAMSDGAYKYWDARPKFSEKTMNSPSAFMSSLRKRMAKNIIDDYTFIGVKVS